MNIDLIFGMFLEGYLHAWVKSQIFDTFLNKRPKNLWRPIILDLHRVSDRQLPRTSGAVRSRRMHRTIPVPKETSKVQGGHHKHTKFG